MFDNGHWKFVEQMGLEPKIGFLYVIKDNYMQKLYLGKKFYRGHGKLNKGKESNWRTYTSSSKFLKEIFKERPKDEFEFICIEEYVTKGTLAYAETWTLCHVDAPFSDVWYNYLIGKIFWKLHEPLTKRHMTRLRWAMEFV